MNRSRYRVRFVVAVVAAIAIAGGTYAYTAANTVAASKAGAGSGSVSGYTISALHFSLNPNIPAHVDSVTFTISPVIPSASSGKVILQLAKTGAPTTYTCTTSVAGGTVTCATISPVQAAIDGIYTATIVAAQ